MRRFEKIIAGLIGACALGIAGIFVAAHEEPSPHAGTENIGTTMSFANIHTNGDPRIQHLVHRMRQSAAGEELYQYAVRTNMAFTWYNKKTGGALGLYKDHTSFLYTSMSDDHALATLVHEIRHHWQLSEIPFPYARMKPHDQYYSAQLREVDACAYTAHFAAAHKDATGERLAIKFIWRPGYGSGIARDYADMDPQDRNYVRDAYEPCFAQVNIYHKKHINFVSDVRDIVVEQAENATDSQTASSVYHEYFNRVSPAQITHMHRQHFTTDLVNNVPVTAIQAMTRHDFKTWFNQNVSTQDPEKLNQADADLNRTAKTLLETMNAKAPAKPKSALEAGLIPQG